MSELTTEIACWRVWNYLQSNGACSEGQVQANVGVSQEQFDSAITIMENTGMVNRSGANYLNPTDREPMFTAIFPTISHHDNGN